ncbi:MAG: 3-isopropylmalate dehydratase small subunit [Elusimicrobia bacterium RIFOXYA2_FULL_39_19]|nr:MAG: 3-isopropylmalate dehydratase small subunit [Elusimicrobia bacterium RIFOXYA2_FULL_39_19]
MEIKGKALKYRDNINTDEIIPAKFLNIRSEEELGRHCMEGIDLLFNSKVRKGDVIVAGRNFGCGSSREHAPVSIKAAGISCVIAESFARIFFRNAINIGLPIIELKDSSKKISENDILEVNLEKGKIINHSKNNEEYTFFAFPEFLKNIINTGGLIPYIKADINKKGVKTK